MGTREQYLKKFHLEDVVAVLKAQNSDEYPFRALPINLTSLKEHWPEEFEKLTFRMNLWTERDKWISALNEVQAENVDLKDHFILKEHFPVTFFNLPGAAIISHDVKCLWKITQVEGRILRTQARKMREMYREFKCRKCTKSIIIRATRELKFDFDEPKECSATKGCSGTPYNTHMGSDEVNYEFYSDYQEIKINPTGQSALWLVELDDELVESCFVGDRITICGTLETRSDRGDVDTQELVIRAVSVYVHENQLKINKDMAELTFTTKDDWQMDLEKYGGDEVYLRNQIVESFAPEIFGLGAIKLGLLITLCSGGSSDNEGGFNRPSKKTREILHLLMVGEPGLGKSQFLKAAAEVSINSVRTVGYATSTAGLTARVFKEAGDTQIEAGALVRANNGICCIDEINLMTKEHRGSIHEVMEHQKVTIAKSGIVMELHTKVSIIAGMNQKNIENPASAENLSIEGSLISRFDLVFELETVADEAHESMIIDHILRGSEKLETSWSLERIKMHILIAKQIHVEVTEDVSEVLQKFYVVVKRFADIEPSRLSLRMYGSLVRIATCHAKLMLRDHTKLLDAAVAIMLMESSWSFGKFLPKFKQEDRLGPSESYVSAVLEKLRLEGLLETKKSPPDSPSYSPLRGPSTQLSQPITDEAVDNIYLNCSDEDDSEDNSQPTESTQQLFSKQQPSKLPSQHDLPFTQRQCEEEPMDFESVQAATSQADTSQVTVPQATKFQAPEKRKSTNMYNYLMSQKKPKSDEAPPVATDLISSNLNALASFFSRPKAGSSIPPSAKPSIAKAPGKVASESSSDLLKRFQYNADTPTQSSTSSLSSPQRNIQIQQVKERTAEEQKVLDGLDEFCDWLG